MGESKCRNDKTEKEKGKSGVRMSRKVERFEDLVAWQKSLDLAVRVYEVSMTGPLAKDFTLRDQMRRSAVSVPSNVAEGFERGSRAEFHHSLSIAKGSAGELRTQLHVARRVGFLAPDVASELLQSAEEVSRVVAKLREAVGHQRDATRRPRNS
jgi:four helix bundle protein